MAAKVTALAAAASPADLKAAQRDAIHSLSSSSSSSSDEADDGAVCKGNRQILGDKWLRRSVRAVCVMLRRDLGANDGVCKAAPKVLDLAGALQVCEPHVGDQIATMVRAACGELPLAQRSTKVVSFSQAQALRSLRRLRRSSAGTTGTTLLVATAASAVLAAVASASATPAAAPAEEPQHAGCCDTACASKGYGAAAATVVDAALRRHVELALAERLGGASGARPAAPLTVANEAALLSAAPRARPGGSKSVQREAASDERRKRRRKERQAAEADAARRTADQRAMKPADRSTAPPRAAGNADPNCKPAQSGGSFAGSWLLQLLPSLLAGGAAAAAGTAIGPIPVATAAALDGLLALGGLAGGLASSSLGRFARALPALACLVMAAQWGVWVRGLNGADEHIGIDPSTAAGRTILALEVGLGVSALLASALTAALPLLRLRFFGVTRTYAREVASWCAGLALVLAAALAATNHSMRRSWADPCGAPEGPVPVMGAESLVSRLGLEQLLPPHPVKRDCTAGGAGMEAAGWVRLVEAATVTVVVVVLSGLRDAASATEGALLVAGHLLQAAVSSSVAWVLLFGSHSCMLTSGCVPAIGLGFDPRKSGQTGMLLTAHDIMSVLALACVAATALMPAVLDWLASPSPIRAAVAAMQRAAAAGFALGMTAVLFAAAAWRVTAIKFSLASFSDVAAVGGLVVFQCLVYAAAAPMVTAVEPDSDE